MITDVEIFIFRKEWRCREHIVNGIREKCFCIYAEPAMFGSYHWIKDGDTPSSNMLVKRKRWNSGWRWRNLHG